MNNENVMTYNDSNFTLTYKGTYFSKYLRDNRFYEIQHNNNLCCKSKNYITFKLKPKRVPSYMNIKMSIEHDDIHMSYYHTVSGVQNIFNNAISGMFFSESVIMIITSVRYFKNAIVIAFCAVTIIGSQIW